MAQVFIGQVENLEDLIRGLESVGEALEIACREQVEDAERQCAEAREETKNSESMLEQASQAERAAHQTLAEAQQKLESAENGLSAADSALSACEAQPPDEDGDGPDCSAEDAAVAEAQAAVDVAQTAIEKAETALEKATEDRQRMEQRVERAKRALSMAEHAFERVQQECTSRMKEVARSIDTGKARLTAAQHALDAYLATNPPAAQFHQWLHWSPEQGKPITPDVIRDRLNLSREEQRLLQEYLYDRNPGYRNMVDKFRGEWGSAKGDVERNIVNRNARIHLCGAYAEHLARHALAPLGGKVETQGRTLVGDDGRYTKTDLIVTDLRVPVVLGRGEGMGAPVGGSLAFEVKCGKADYLYQQKDHMLFQAEGHKQADAHFTLCSRDIHDLPPEKEKELRDALRAAGSPLVGMLPAKNDIDHSCLAFVHLDKEGDLQ
jgi:chemotaxis protein histidine kinase CheA